MMELFGKKKDADAWNNRGFALDES